MKLVKIIALTAALAAGTSAVYANPLNAMGVDSLGSIQEARSATVLTVTATEARFLSIDSDVSSVRARIQSNPALMHSIEAQGFSLEQIVGVSGKQTGLTLYAL